MSKLAAVVVIAGCSTPTADVLTARQIPTELQPDVASVVTGNNQFACDAYGKLIAGDQNLVFSPFSIATAFAMLDAGAAGQSDAELRAAFHVSLAGDRAHAAYGALLASLATGRDFGQYTLATADKLFGQQGFPFLDAFVSTTRDDYQAEMLPVDFADDPDGVIDTIDHWVSDQTDGKIPMLFNHGDLDSSTVLAIVNAILFKGTWEQHFDHDATHDGPFHKADGSTATAPLMQREGSVSVGAIPGGHIGVMPFNGKDIEMVILLPDAADGLSALEAQLTGDAIAGWIANVSPVDDTVVVLPKFGVTSAFDLPSTMQALGVTTIFDPATADLAGIDGGRDLYVNKVVHQAMITVDEDGAEAAAATGIGVGDSSAPAPFQADHPFIFMIHDAVTGSILFMGRVEDPST